MKIANLIDKSNDRKHAASHKNQLRQYTLKDLQQKNINNKHLFIFALSLFTKHCNPLANTLLH